MIIIEYDYDIIRPIVIIITIKTVTHEFMAELRVCNVHR